MSGTRSRWLANTADLESRGVAAHWATRVYTFPSSRRWFELPWRRKGSRTKESRGNIVAVTSMNRNIIWETDILYLFLSWSCAELSPVVSFFFVRLYEWLLRGSIRLQAASSIYSTEITWLATLHHFKGALGLRLSRTSSPILQAATDHKSHSCQPHAANSCHLDSRNLR